MTKLFVASAAAIALATGAQVAPDSGSGLASIATEIRLLRGSIDKANDSQIQVQAISVYLTNEQGRLTQLANRLDAVRRDLDAAAAESRAAAEEVAQTERSLAGNSVPERRSQLEETLAGQRRDADLQAQKESQLRLRETDASQEFQTARDQYTAMVTRLQQFIK